MGVINRLSIIDRKEFCRSGDILIDLKEVVLHSVRTEEPSRCLAFPCFLLKYRFCLFELFPNVRGSLFGFYECRIGLHLLFTSSCSLKLVCMIIVGTKFLFFNTDCLFIVSRIKSALFGFYKHHVIEMLG